MELSANSKKPETGFSKTLDFVNQGGLSGYYSDYRAALTPNRFNPQLRIFAEGRGGLKLGAALGLGYISPLVYDEQETGPTAGYLAKKYSLNSFYVPADIYIKYRPRGERLSLSLGGGADYMMGRIKAELQSNSQTASGVMACSALMPHASAGAELFVFKNVSLAAEFKYIFNGLLDNFSGELSDPSGFLGGSGRYSLQMKPMTGGAETLYLLKDGGAPAALSRPFSADYTGLWGQVALRVYF
ncbi:MAG: hypothetical protein WC421_11555 [Elusimicrobiales bacterium]